jgi:hypothetical protein
MPCVPCAHGFQELQSRRNVDTLLGQRKDELHDKLFDTAGARIVRTLKLLMETITPVTLSCAPDHKSLSIARS